MGGILWSWMVCHKTTPVFGIIMRFLVSTQILSSLKPYDFTLIVFVKFCRNLKSCGFFSSWHDNLTKRWNTVSCRLVSVLLKIRKYKNVKKYMLCNDHRSYLCFTNCSGFFPTRSYNMSTVNLHDAVFAYDRHMQLLYVQHKSNHVNELYDIRYLFQGGCMWQSWAEIAPFKSVFTCLCLWVCL